MKNLLFTAITYSISISEQVCSNTQVDIVFIIDSSHSVSANDFDYIKMWLRNVISSLPIGPGLAQVKKNNVLATSPNTLVGFCY